MPSSVTHGSHKKVWWLGACGHEWQAAVSDRSIGKGCPVCDAKNKTSFPEKAMFLYVSQRFSDAVATASFPWLGKQNVDIYIPSIKTAIEYDGQAWHMNIERDARKNKLCSENGVRLIRIREPNCPFIEGECICLKSIEIAELERAIKTLLSCHLGIDEAGAINLVRDREKIVNLIELERK